MKYAPQLQHKQLQHNMWVVAARSAVLSVITGGDKKIETKTHAEPVYQDLRPLIFPLLPLTQTHPRPPTVFVDELNPGPLQYGRDSGERLLIARIPAGLDIGDRVAMKLSGFCEVTDGPV